MPVSTMLRRRTNFQLSSARAVLLQSFYLRAIGGRCPSSTHRLKTPLGATWGISILRHLSVTPNLQIFAKLTSLISKLAVEPEPVEKPAEHRLVSQVDPKLETMHQEMMASGSEFLEQYNQDLKDLVKQVEPPPKGLPKDSLVSLPKRTYKKRERALKTKEKLRFFHFDKLSRPMVTSQFKSTYEFLRSVGVPCDELQYFPDIQRMTQDEILMCIERLRSYGIHRVFSLFLLQRTLAEMKIGITVTNPSKMRDGRIPVPYLSQVRLYLSLCEMLDRPDLDIISLLDQLTETNGYESMATLQTKVKKLLSVGATPEVIWSNMELLTISRDIFDRKIKLYKRSRLSPNTPFPVALFLSKSFVTFQERLNVGPAVVEIAEMLDISTEDFQACWGFKKLNLKELVQKVRMCIKVGIPKRDVFNNLSILDNIPTKKCYEVTTRFQESGLPVSIFIFREMDQANGINGGQLSSRVAELKGGPRGRKLGEDRGTNVDGDPVDYDGLDWTGNHDLARSGEEGLARPLPPLEQPSPQRAKRKKKSSSVSLDGAAASTTSTPGPAVLASREVATRTRSKRPPKVKVAYNTVESSKRSRRVLYHLVAHLLSLEPDVMSGMFRCGLSVTAVNRLDVTRNLDFLVAPTHAGGAGFTLGQVARCPLVLVHPHAKLKAAARAALEMVDLYLASSSLTLAPSSPQAALALAHWEELDEDDGDEEDGGGYAEGGVTLGSKKPAVNTNVGLTDAEFHLSDLSVSSSSSSSPSSSSPSTVPSVSSAVPPSRASSSSNLASPPPPASDKTGTSSNPKSCVSRPVADTTDAAPLKSLLFSCPERHLNLLQYLVERESSFSLGSSEANVASGFLNRPL